MYPFRGSTVLWIRSTPSYSAPDTYTYFTDIYTFIYRRGEETLAYVLSS